MAPRAPHIQADMERYHRQGIPEAVYCPGKTLKQIKQMCRELTKGQGPVILTKIESGPAKPILSSFQRAKHYPDAKLIIISPSKPKRQNNNRFISVLSAGTADVSVAEEAALVAESLGTRVKRFYDVGVAGLHRTLRIKEDIEKSCGLVVVAGMEGALPSVVGGLARCPVIAVPTSVGYGTALGGVAALLCMLNSCAPNVCTVNIDDGFGAGVIGHLIANGSR